MQVKSLAYIKGISVRELSINIRIILIKFVLWKH